VSTFLSAAVDAKHGDRAPFSDLVEVDDDSRNCRSLRSRHGDGSVSSSSGGNPCVSVSDLVQEGRSALHLIDAISVDSGIDFFGNFIVLLGVVLENLRASPRHPPRCPT
jgi:hypothetical protein